MIVSEEQLTKEKTESGEVWTTPWRMTRSEAYVDLVDATDYAQAYAAKHSLKAEANIIDDWNANQHRAVYTFAKHSAQEVVTVVEDSDQHSPKAMEEIAAENANARAKKEAETL